MEMQKQIRYFLDLEEEYGLKLQIKLLKGGFDSFRPFAFIGT